MKKLLRTVIVLLISIELHSYGSEARLNDLSSFQSGFLPLCSSSRPSIPVLRLGTQSQQQEAGQSAFEMLPQEVLELIRQNLAQKGTFPLISQKIRGYTQGLITRLVIPVKDVTEENLQDTKENFPKVTSLTIQGLGITSQQIILLARVFPNITFLNLSGTGLTLKEIFALSKPNTFSKLKILNIRGNSKLENSAIMALGQASFASKLKELDLRQAAITLAGVKILSQPTIFAALRSLKLSASETAKIGDKGISIIALSSFARTLKTLYLENEDITVTGVRILSTNGVFKALKVLSLKNNKEIGDLGLSVLAKSSLSGQLELLNLTGTRITTVGIRALKQFSPFFTALRVLKLASNEIGDSGIEALISLPLASTLQSLDLANTSVTPVGISMLSLSDVFKSLKSICLANNYKPRMIATGQITFDEEFEEMVRPDPSNLRGDAIIRALAQGMLSEQLKSIDLHDIGQISEIGLKILSQSGKFIALKMLNLSDNKIVAHLKCGPNIFSRKYEATTNHQAIWILANAAFAGKLELLQLGSTVPLAIKQQLKELGIAERIT